MDSATAGETLEDNQPLSARCTSCSEVECRKWHWIVTSRCHLGLLWCGSLASADCPNWLVGNHYLAPVSHIFGNCCQLTEANLGTEIVVLVKIIILWELLHLISDPSLSFLKFLTNAREDIQSGL